MRKTFLIWLFVLMIIAFISVLVVSFSVLTKQATENTNLLIQLKISDVEKQIALNEENLVRIRREADEKTVCLRFVDEGIPFNPLETSEINTNLQAHERTIGGLGIHMIKRMTDRVAYDFKDGENVIIVEKDIQ